MELKEPIKTFLCWLRLVLKINRLKKSKNLLLKKKARAILVIAKKVSVWDSTVFVFRMEECVDPIVIALTVLITKNTQVWGILLFRRPKKLIHSLSVKNMVKLTKMENKKLYTLGDAIAKRLGVIEIIVNVLRLGLGVLMSVNVPIASINKSLLREKKWSKFSKKKEEKNTKSWLEKSPIKIQMLKKHKILFRLFLIKEKLLQNTFILNNFIFHLFFRLRR